jgi:hypothetical protein
MNLSFIVLIIILTLLNACSDARGLKQTDSQPKALQQNNSSFGISKGRRDLLSELYAELLQKDTALDRLENQIAALPEIKIDSMAALNAFTKQNSSYYQDAQSLIERMLDESWKKLADSLVKKSLLNYEGKIASRQQLKKQLEKREAELRDLHALCQLAFTLPLIEAYQSDLPSTTPMQHYKNQLDTVAEKTKRMAADKLNN